MVHYLRKLKVKFVGEQKFLPQDMPEGKFIPVLGYSTKKITVKNEDGNRESDIEGVVFHCIGISGKIVHVAEFNCAVMIDGKAEIEALTIASEICGKLSMAIGNCNSLLKYLSSEVEKRDLKGGSNADADQG